jgi:hypothetical protein
MNPEWRDLYQNLIAADVVYPTFDPTPHEIAQPQIAAPASGGLAMTGNPRRPALPLAEQAGR